MQSNRILRASLIFSALGLIATGCTNRADRRVTQDAQDNQATSDNRATYGDAGVVPANPAPGVTDTETTDSASTFSGDRSIGTSGSSVGPSSAPQGGNRSVNANQGTSGSVSSQQQRGIDVAPRTPGPTQPSDQGYSADVTDVREDQGMSEEGLSSPGAGMESTQPSYQQRGAQTGNPSGDQTGYGQPSYHHSRTESSTTFQQERPGVGVDTGANNLETGPGSSTINSDERAANEQMRSLDQRPGVGVDTGANNLDTGPGSSTVNSDNRAPNEWSEPQLMREIPQRTTIDSGPRGSSVR